MTKLPCLIAWPALLLGITAGQTANGQNGKFEGIPDRLSKGVVQVIAYNNGKESIGTGFVVKDDVTIITNYHIVENARIVYVWFRFMDRPH